MAKFVRTVPVEFNAIQFKYRGTAQETRVAAMESTELADMDYWEFFDNALANEVKSTWLKINPNNPDDVVLNVRVRWYESYNDERMEETFELREGDWLVEDYTANPVYRAMTPALFAALGAVPEDDD